MTILRGIDTDNYDGEISVARFQNLRENHGVAFNIVGLEAGMPFARSQQQNAEAAGIVVPIAYKFPYWTAGDLEGMRRAAGFGLPVAIDCEWANGMPGGPEATVERIHECRDILMQEGRYWGIYTGGWWWPANTGNSQAFKDDPLWHAAYPFGGGALPPRGYLPDFETFEPYGGWLRPAIWQFADTCYDEPTFDLNAWDAQPATPPPPAPEETSNMEMAIIYLSGDGGQPAGTYVLHHDQLFLIPSPEITAQLEALIYQNEPAHVDLPTWQFLDQIGIRRVL